MNKIALLYTVIFLLMSYVYIKNTLHMFQQNRYEFYRYSKWLFNKTNLKPNINVVYIALMVICLFFAKYYSYVLVLIISIIFAIYQIIKEDKKEYIKPLVFTSRIKRTLVLFYIVCAIIYYFVLCLLDGLYPIGGILSIYLPYVIIYPVAFILKPVEFIIKKYYENDAKKILNENPNLIKIGITGSYGKTTTKNIVNGILSSSYYSLMTPASYNTPMGITRTIREQLKRVHEVFVCEMGADHVNDIGYLMKMVKPKYGIVVSIGPQHLNTFGLLRNIIDEKMKEIELLPSNGVGIINIDNEYIRNYEIKNNCKIIKIGVENEDADINAKKVIYSKDGSSFNITINSKSYKFKTKLLGSHNITNVLCGIALGLELGIDVKTIQKAVESLQSVEHRLEVKNINGYTFIDDAFNSNPVGCQNALKVLSMMTGKRVIVTPGLIDLGASENESNYNFGYNMINNVDMAILVGKTQTNYIYKGLVDSGFDKNNIIVVNKVKEAFEYIYSNLTRDDTILLENDLPDAFNK